MTILFFDSSALVKRYLNEQGSVWVRSLTDVAANNTVFVAEITRVETAAAFAARQRAPNGISQQERDRLFALLVMHEVHEYARIPMLATLIDRAMLLTQQYRLRGYDAVQLAAALATVEAVRLNGLADPIFVSADTDLLAAAHAEGLSVDNPNHH